MNPEQKAAGYRQYTWSIPVFRANQVTEKVKALSGTAKKCGMPGFSLKYGGSSIQKINIDSQLIDMEMVDVTLIGGPPKINGWQFVAKIDHDDDAGNVVFGYNDDLINKSGREGLADWLAECKPNCEHCNVNRSRNSTFLFSHENDPTSLVQLGSSCVKDFSGHPDPSTILLAATTFRDLMVELDDPDSIPGSTMTANAMLSFPYVVSVASAVVNQDGGWIPKDDHRGFPNPGATTAKVHNELLGKKPNVTISDADEERARHIIAWLTDERFDHKDQMYRANLSNLAKRGYVPKKGIGLAASAVVAFERELEKVQEMRANNGKPVSQYIGDKGERVERTVKLEKIIPCDGEFGISLLHLFRDVETGAKMTWFNSGTRSLAEGQTYDIKGRVKLHETRDGVKQTQLTRVSCPDIKLHDALCPGMDDAAVLKKLKKVGDIDAQTDRNETLLYKASKLNSFYSIGRAIVEELLERGADPGIRSSESGDTPFDIWVFTEEEDLVLRTLEKQPELAARWSDDRFAFYEVEDAPWVSKLKEVRDQQIEMLVEEKETSRIAAINSLFDNSDKKPGPVVGGEGNALSELDEDESEGNQLRLA